MKRLPSRGLTILAFVAVLQAGLLATAAPARAECNCVAVAVDVSAAVKGRVELADNLFATGDYAGALRAYADAYAQSPEPPLLYAQGMTHWALGASADAEAAFGRYLSAGGTLRYRARAEAALGSIRRGVAFGAGAVGGTVGAVGGAVEGVGGTAVGGVGAVGGAVGGAADVPKVRPAKTVAIILGIGAVVGVGLFLNEAISARKPDVDFDAKFGLGMGIGGVGVGIAAVSLFGITVPAATGGVRCADAEELPRRRYAGPIVAPVAYPSGGGVGAAFSF